MRRIGPLILGTAVAVLLGLASPAQAQTTGNMFKVASCETTFGGIDLRAPVFVYYATNYQRITFSFQGVPETNNNNNMHLRIFDSVINQKWAWNSSDHLPPEGGTQVPSDSNHNPIRAETGDIVTFTAIFDIKNFEPDPRCSGSVII